MCVQTEYRWSDILKRVTVKTTESEVNTETTAYGLVKSFSSDPSNKSLYDASCL